MSEATQKNPLVYIVVLNWNNSEDTVQTLDSLQKVAYKRFRVIVVDNNSEDDSVQKLNTFINEKALYDTELIQNKENLGFAGGNNVGIKKSLDKGADYVLVLNNDVSVAQDFLGKLVDKMEQNDNIGAATGVIYFSGSPNEIWFGGETHIKWRKMNRAVTNDLFGKTMPEFMPDLRVDFVTGTCMFLRRNVLEKLGGFDERFFLYFEDADLSLSIQKEGWELLWTPDAEIWHKVSATTLPQMGKPSIHYYDHRNILLLTKKHGPLWTKLYKHIWAGYTIIKQLIKIVIGRNRDISKAILHGIADYYRSNYGKYIIRNQT